MKEYNCPDCERTDSCEDCIRVIIKKEELNKVAHIPPYFPDSIIWSDLKAIPTPCKHCNNHPINGGSGICFCTLGSQTIY